MKMRQQAVRLSSRVGCIIINIK
uniref:Uncharacterized protein n=1 Tax=Heterorhabditis bacteriophora TaxID=37862 RepID=A0A1I7X1P3_HETBA